MRREQPLAPGIQAPERRQERQRRRGEVHDEVRDGGGDGDDGRRRRRRAALRAAEAGHAAGDAQLVLARARQLEQLGRALADEGVAVRVEGAHVVADLVARDGVAQRGDAVGVEVVGPHEDALLAGGDGEGADAGHDVADHVAGLEHGDQPAVLGVEPRVPVDLCVVEAEGALLLLDLDVEVVGAGEDLVGEGAEGGRLADHVDFVDHGFDGGVFVHEDLRDEGFVGEVGFADVEVGWGAVSSCGYGECWSSAYRHAQPG